MGGNLLNKYKPAKYKIVDWELRYKKAKDWITFNDLLIILEDVPEKAQLKLEQILTEKTNCNNKKLEMLRVSSNFIVINEMIKSLKQYIRLEKNKNVCGARIRKSES